MRSHRLILLATSTILAACSSTPDGGEAANGHANELTVRVTPPGDGVGGNVGAGASLSDGNFTFHALGTRCVDIGGQPWWTPGEPVILYSCNGSVAQQLRVREIDPTHDVELRPLAPSNLCIGVRGGVVMPGAALELQTCNGQPWQRFALDGDTILVGTQRAGQATRDFVVEPAGDDTRDRTPLVVGTREVSDAEYFVARATLGTSKYPTSGFVKVSNEQDLNWALDMGWGTVIEIDDAKPLEITSTTEKLIRSGTTLRGYRRFAHQGPQILHTFHDDGDHAAFLIGDTSDHVRVTGLRLQGPTRHRDTSLPKVRAITIQSPSGQRVGQKDVLVDHIDGSDWTGGVVNVLGSNVPDAAPGAPPDAPVCDDGMTYPRQAMTKVLRNFFHHNVGGEGYGAVTGNGGYMLVEGTVAYMNLHSIVADGVGTTGYTARDNFLLSESAGPGGDSDQDMDVHGSLHPGEWYDGTSGDVFDVGWNTFLSTQHHNFSQRGTPCHYAYFHDNVTTRAQSDSAVTQSVPKSTLIVANDKWLAGDPTNDLGVGDFDGDGVDDVFVGTGVTWWFSSSGASEWRFMNRMPERASQLRFGDFDGDGRTDVLAVHGQSMQVSWAGSSPWFTLAATRATLADLAIGDFDGDHFSDVFAANGREWTYASRGTTWTHLAWQSLRTSDVRLGDFTADGRTDVLGVIGGAWQIVRGGGAGAFELLGPARTATMAGLVVADFDGDAFADVARSTGSAWQISSRGTGAFSALRSSSDDITTLPIGRFDGPNRSADVVFWPSLHFGLAPAGRDPVVTMYSRQDMR